MLFSSPKSIFSSGLSRNLTNGKTRFSLITLETFSKEFVYNHISEYLKNKEIMQLISREFKVKPFNTYKIPKGKKEPTGIYSQISRGYFNDGDGVINLIKNKKIGNAGKGTLYCTVDEAIDAKLTIDDLDLEKLYNELAPFIKYVEVKNEPKETLAIPKENVIIKKEDLLLELTKRGLV